jgi:hypothetical protein
MSEDVEDLIALAQQTGWKAPLFRLPSANEREEILPLLPLLTLTERQINLIDAALKVAGSNEHNMCTLVAISQALDNSVANVRKHFKALLEVGILRETKCTTDPVNRRIGSLFVLQKPAHIYNSEPPTIPDIQNIPLSNVDIINPAKLTDVANSDLITSVLFGALNYNRKSRESKLESNVVWRGARVPVKSISNTGERIAFISDIRYYIAIQNVLEQIIREDIEYRETFNIPLNAILAVMGKLKSAGEKNNALAAIRRLSSTTFQIARLPQWLLQQSGMSADSKLNITILHLKLEAVSDDLEGKTVLQIQFPRELILALLAKINNTGQGSTIQLITAINPIVMSIKDKMVLAFGLWSQFYFKRNTIESCSWVELKNRIAPQLSIREFKIEFSKTLRLHECKAYKVIEQEGEMIKVVDTSYQPEFAADLAIKITAKILGVNMVLSDEEFFLTADYADKFVGIEALGYMSKRL